MHGIFLLAAVMSIVSLLLIIFFIFSSGVPLLSRYGFWDFVSGDLWRPRSDPPLYGVLPFILGSVYVTIGAVVIGVPIGVLTAVFMAEFCPKKLYKVLKPGVNLMAGIPSILFGFFALRIIVPFVREQFGGGGNSLLAAQILLGIMILPTIITLSESALRSVPRSYYSGSVALGASHERTIFTVLLPAAKSGIFSSIVLGLGRAIGETMAVVMVAGNQPLIPDSLTRGVRTLTTNIVLEMAYSSGEHQEALIATGVILFIFILFINGTFLYIKNRKGAD